MFHLIIEYGEKSQNIDLKFKILDGTSLEDDNEELFIKLVKKIKTRSKGEIPENFYQSIIDYKPNAYIDFYKFVTIK